MRVKYMNPKCLLVDIHNLALKNTAVSKISTQNG